ncbi:shikimate dehydrogenase [Paraburkholderia tagetis]|uniref:Shikimate dehydrogenase (NADP(+)) n=1 Tax=Paraburkholderia tagetis TaxID=2913261 RepID=A0A9X1UDM5_9BURK|nr:shikimate dehydrogenase [Paraburkholderia tagetis]MCG5072789.1 shikimate dehydrogenase [Paraburkholderia tagetis]
MSADPIQRDRYAVVGNPVAHSKSPYIHAQFAAATGEPVEYDRLLAPLDGFVEHVQAFRAAGGRGLNVTVPFKLEAHALASRLSPRAAAAGAVNTLRFDEDGIFGDNTDGFGLVRDIEVNLGVSLKGARVLLLGAGGAARGVVLPMLERQPREITIVNRTAQKAHALVEQFEAAAREAACLINGGGPDAVFRDPVYRDPVYRDPVYRDPIDPKPYDVIVNATAGSLDAALPECDARAFGAGTLAYDMMYGAEPTVFMRHAESLGARASDGLGMLVEQAAESFFVWRGVRPDGAPVLAALRKQLAAQA